MTHRLIRRLENFTRLADSERQALLDAIGPVQQFGPREDVIPEGSPVDGISLILEGLACRYKVLPDKRRQILGYLLPGDICDLRVFALKEIDHTVATLSPVCMAAISREQVQELTETYPGIKRALGWGARVEEATTREWLVSVGQRTAFERLAHFVCEMFFRLRAVDLTAENSCELPLTQAELGDTLGLSTVHVNRTLQDLRREGLITLRGKKLIIHDLAALQSVAMFNPRYLHSDGRDEQHSGADGPMGKPV